MPRCFACTIRAIRTILWRGRPNPVLRERRSPKLL